MYRFDINSKNEGQFTSGKFAQHRAKWKINNYGWNSPIDYYRKKEIGKTRIAIIGDSFIEAFQVDVEKSYPSQLRAELGNDYEVYSFGISGAPLSQYLHISRYVNRTFNPEILIFNIVHNDFAESISQLNPEDVNWLSIDVKNGVPKESLPRPDYSFSQYNFKKRILKKSALFRYIYQNLKLYDYIKYVLQEKEEKKYNANVDINKLKENKEIIVIGTKYILNQIRLENPEQRVIVIIDASRRDIYANKSDVYIAFWHRILGKYCLENKFEVIDLTQSMKKDYESNHIKFNSEPDFHWNEYGHRFVSTQILEQLKIPEFLVQAGNGP